MEKKKSEDKSICHPFSFSLLPLSSRKAVKEAQANFPDINEGFINYFFWRNWAVRSRAGTRLDSYSLVNTQFAPAPAPAPGTPTHTSVIAPTPGSSGCCSMTVPLSYSPAQACTQEPSGSRSDQRHPGGKQAGRVQEEEQGFCSS